LIFFLTRCQFHQYSTFSFYVGRSQKRKKDWQLDCLFCSFRICMCKSCLLSIDETDLRGWFRQHFYEKLLQAQISKVQKIVFLRFMGSVRVKAAHKTVFTWNWPQFFWFFPHQCIGQWLSKELLSIANTSRLYSNRRKIWMIKDFQKRPLIIRHPVKGRSNYLHLLKQ